MRKVQLVTLGLLSQILISCGDMSVSTRSATEILPIPESMYYKMDGSCEDGSLFFQALQGAGVQLWTDPQSVLVGQVELYMNQDETYFARYREYDFTSKVFEKEFSSTYSYDPKTGRVTFKDLGVAKVVKVVRVSTKYYLDFEFTVNINSQNLAGKTLRYRIAKMDRGVDTDRNQYCNYAP
ncbi:MAG: hypothetical protein KUL82_13400 [Bdellovibrio sp.]|nr:hypothetical protein [Bdellovibrio sp.]